ncbi:predicted protein [Thalassiosira pseudonana CCMP1335]|uniref:NADP-dependent oxidoreductase domain-containing protein n=1 Tax=Thalassiosira pseudonana TaxID=35128 RepID=B8BYV1_THAPS|nr:predicted protein [Thalassiosira pseudonana CCMP1335]EED94440.1 predicted protein [Thalassiosira pseudonana CCMP1335]
MIFARSVVLSLLSVICNVSALSLHTSHRATTSCQRTSSSSLLRTPTTLHLGDLDDLSDYGKQKAGKELAGLQNKREQMKRAKLAYTKPDDDKPKIEEMSDEEIAAMFANKDESDMEEFFEKNYMPTWKTKRSPSAVERLGGGGGGSMADDDKDGEGEEKEQFVFVDWTDESADDNEFHIPNRIGFSTVEWGDVKKGFVNGKLKKADRKQGKFNKTDLKKAYEKLQQSGISFVETSESFANSESFLKKFLDECEHGDRALVASTFSNPWKKAVRSRKLPRFGSNAINEAAEKSCEKMGVSSMSLYQVQNPWVYVGGSSALAEGMLDVIQDDHSRYVGCVDMSVSKLAKLQKKLRDDGEFVATNQFEFSLTNRKNLGMITTCKKLGITPICRNVLDGGLATGKYTSTNPTGGEVSKGEGDMGPYPLRKLEKLDPLFRTLEKLAESVGKRIGSDLLKYESRDRPNINTGISTTQIAIAYVRAKGAVPLLSITNSRAANELLGCLGWDLTEEEVDQLDKACQSCGC